MCTIHHAPRPQDLNPKLRLLLLQVTREAFARYMHVIKRALTEAAAKESSRAAGVTADPHGTPALSSEQAAGASMLHAMTHQMFATLGSTGCEAVMRLQVFHLFVNNG